MAKKNAQYIFDNPDSTFIGFLFTMKNKVPGNFKFAYSAEDIVPMTGGFALMELKNYKKTIFNQKMEIARLKNEKDDLVEDLITLANMDFTEEETSDAGQDELRTILGKHGIDYYPYDDDEDYDDEE